MLLIAILNGDCIANVISPHKRKEVMCELDKIPTAYNSFVWAALPLSQILREPKCN